MGRPPLPVGTWGKIRCYELPSGKWRAIANYKDYDGVTRPVECVGDTRAKAERSLLERLRDRVRVDGSAELQPNSTVADAAAIYLRELDASDKAARTKQTYHDTWDRYLDKAVGAFPLERVKVSTVNRVITKVRDNTGRGAAIHCKVVLTALFAVAVRHDAVQENPVREIESLGQRKKGTKTRTVDRTNIGQVLGTFHASPVAKKWDLVDMVDVLSGLGCRIGELLALDWVTSVDFDAGTIRFHGTVIRIPKEGLHVQDHTKSRAGMRTIKPPAWVMDILKRRHAESDSRWVFPTTTGTLRDADNTRARLRDVVKGTPFKGLHPHEFRHYVADVLDARGRSAREIADYLGHERISTTQEDYMARGVVAVDISDDMAERPRIEQPPEKRG